MRPPLHIRVLTSDQEIADAYPLVAELRPHVIQSDFLAAVREQEDAGYRLAAGFDESGTLVALAGYRFTRTLSRGPHLFVDDLVTASSAQKRGHGKTMLAWLGRVALDAGIEQIWLDSRATAKSFYEQAGFEFVTAIPCRIAATKASAL